MTARVAPGATPPLDPSTDEARRWLLDELARPGYRTELSPVERFKEWLAEVLAGLGGPGAPAFLLPVVLAVLFAAVALVIMRVVRRDPRGGRDRGAAVLTETGVSAQEYAARARSALAAGDASAALLDAFRGIVAGAVERTLLVDFPGRTAHEAVEDLAPLFPTSAAALRRAGVAFDEVRYGDRSADEADAGAVLALAADLTDATPQWPGSGAPTALGAAP